MSFDAIQTGVVIDYPYLWAREAARGETEGRKSRPVTVGVRIRQASGDDILVLFPITSKAPMPKQFAVEVPEIEKKRAGLDQGIRLWIILDEYNQDSLTRSFYLEPTPPRGVFSRAFFLPVLREFISRRESTISVNRRG